jgi:hypothetical protein
MPRSASALSGAVEAHLAVVDGVIDAQLALVHARAERAQWRRRRAQIVPRHRLRLLEEGREIGEARANFSARHRRALQILDAGDRLAGAAVRHNAGEAFGPDMEAFELAAGRVVGDEIGFTHGMFTWGLVAPRSERASQRESR